MTDHPTGDDGNGNKSAKRAPEVTYDIGEAELPSEAVVWAVAALTNTSVVDLDPLYDVMDPDHLDRLFEGTGDGDAPEERSVTFGFNGCQVTVTRDAVLVHDGDRTTS